MKSAFVAPEWIAISEAGARLHLSHNQVLRLAMRGELDGKREGLRWWVARSPTPVRGARLRSPDQHAGGAVMTHKRAARRGG
jgi:hypothetical protein